MANSNPLGLTATLDRLSRARRVPAPLVMASLAPFAWTGYLGRHGLKARRLTSSLSLPIDPLANINRDVPPVDVVIPCGPGDVKVLPRVIKNVPTGITNSINTIQVVGPTATIAAIKSEVDSQVVLVNENDLLGSTIIDSIGQHFPSRRNWVLQQVVKVASVLTSKSRGVLVLDADTILLSPRTWVTSDGRQILTPTIEWHQPYYEFLNRLSRGYWRAPKYSFVPHHMLMQPDIMALILTSLGITGIQGLVSALGQESEYDVESMFCIEYELYAQGLLNLRPELAVLAKWSNHNVPRTKSTPTDKYSKYMSISQHHYLS